MERVQTHPQVNQVPRQANPFEAGIEGPLGNGFIRQRIQNFIRDAFSLCQIDHLHFAAVHGIAEDKNLKGWRLCILVYAAPGQVHTAKGLQVTTQSSYFNHENDPPFFILLIVSPETLYIAANSIPFIPQYRPKRISCTSSIDNFLHRFPCL